MTDLSLIINPNNNGIISAKILQPVLNLSRTKER
jgi:hypothetical protein